MGVFVSNADAISQDLDALVLVIHHAGKSQDRGMRGSSALHGAADAEWEVLSEEAGKSIRIAKMKDGEDDLSFMFRLRSVEVGEDEDGDPVTTLVTEILNTPEHSATSAQPRKKLTGQKAEFIKAVTVAISEMDGRVPVGEHVPINTVGVTKQHLALYADKLGSTDGKSPEVRKATLNRHIRTLAGDGHIAQWGEWIWLTR